MVVRRLPVRSMNSANAATSVRMCCASMRTASDGPDTRVDVVAANVPAPCSKGRNGPMNTSACSLALALLIGTSVRGAVDVAGAQELFDVGGKLGMVLEQEPVRGVRVDLDRGPWNQSGEQVGEVRQDHGVAL